MDVDRTPFIEARRLLFLQYAARLAPRHSLFRWPTIDVLVRIQEALYLDLGLGNDDQDDDQMYRKAFLKELIARLEDAQGDDVEICGELLEAYALLLSSTLASSGLPKARTVTHYAPVTLGQTFDPAALLPSFRPIYVEEEGTTISRGTTGLRTWEAALRLAAHLVAHPEMLLDFVERDRLAAAMELGCGTGFLGVVAASLVSGQLSFHLTDLPEEVLKMAKKTVERNKSSVDLIRVGSFDWELTDQADADVFEDRQAARPSLFFAADVVFDPSLVEPFCDALARLFRSYSGQAEPTAYIASTIRNQATFRLFTTTLERRSFHLERLSMSVPWIDLRSMTLVDDKVARQNEEFRFIPLFPSTHSSLADGEVCLLRLSLPSYARSL